MIKSNAFAEHLFYSNTFSCKYYQVVKIELSISLLLFIYHCLNEVDFKINFELKAFKSGSPGV